MKKRVISLLCVLCLLFSSCKMLGLDSQKGKKEDKKQTEVSEDKEKKDDNDEKTGEKTKKLKKETKKTDKKYIQEISLDNIINKGIYEGFTEKQEKMLRQNGFVVMEPNFDSFVSLKMHQPYEHMEYHDHSMMITTDAVLHLWHVFYSESMKAMELSKYLPNLKELSLEMEKKAIVAYINGPDALDSAYANVIAFFHVANTLLRDESERAVWYETELDEEISGDALEIAEKELELIRSETPKDSVLFNRSIDYSQFKVRGHYTTGPDLSRYFQAMMWYGFTGFDLKKQPDEALIISELLLQDDALMKLWNKNYELTSLYSGESDDITILEMKKAMGKELQDGVAEQLINEKSRKKLLKLFDKLPQPRIVANLSEENASHAVEKAFKFMGQRFSVDAYIMQNLMEPYKRPMPTSFDVFTAMGSETAEKVLRENYNTNQNWPEYDEILENMTEEYKEGKLTDGDNFYNGWIRAIDATLNSIPEGKQIPYFMSTEAYEYKKLNSALGSFAELKHDNILYSKQAMAEMGGPEGNNTLHYLEPNEDLYQELLTLTTHAEKMLKKEKLDEEMIVPLSRIKEILLRFVEISRKELNGENISKEDLHELNYFGGLVEYVATHYLYMLASQGYEIESPKTTALIADIATVLPTENSEGGYLEVATGYPYTIYVLCHVNGVDFLASGVVYSAFEFMSLERFTDEEWQAAIGLGEEKDGEYSFPKVNAENYDAIRDLHMQYYDQYASTEKNNISIGEVEINWPALKN